MTTQLCFKKVKWASGTKSFKMDIRAVIAYYESKTSSAPNLTKTSVTSVAKRNLDFRLKRKPAFHDKKWRQSVREWQEKASKDRKAALTANHILRFTLFQNQLKSLTLQTLRAKRAKFISKSKNI